MSGNYKEYDECCRYEEKEKEEERQLVDIEFRGVETLAHGLKKFRYKNILVFEENVFVFGRVKSVINNSVLVLEDGVKFVEGIGFFPFRKVFISISRIAEFIPYTNVTAESIVGTLKESGKTQIIPDLF